MKSAITATTLAAALALGPMTTAASAGSLAGPAVEQDIIIQQAATSSINPHLLPPVLFVAFVGASLLFTPTAALSDARLKTDVTRAGTADNGLPLYHFRYAGQSQTWEGVMAQDVLSHTPEAVIEVGDYYAVDYGMLGLEMRAVD